jgi:erythronate-4-phosphate dehydrogenase
MFQFALAMMTAAHYFSSVEFMKHGISYRNRVSLLNSDNFSFLKQKNCSRSFKNCYLSFVNFMKMIRIVADDKIPFLKGILESFANVTWLPAKQINRDAVMNADALLIRTRTKCNADLLEGTAVKFIGTSTIGFDHIDTAYCEANNIRWTNAPGCNSSSVQQYIAAALLKISSQPGFDLRNKTLGIVGVGNVGTKIEKLAGILGMKVLLNDPPRARKEKKNDFVRLDELLAASDIISLHVPLSMTGNDKTWHLFDHDTFNKVRTGTWFINSARGEVVNTEALKEALVHERLAGSVLDVWEKEPEIDIPLMHMSFLATPHIAGYSTDGKANGTAMTVKALSEVFDIPLAGWFPAEIPVPPEPELIIDSNGKSDAEIVRRAVIHSYNIDEDDVRLRFDPSRFEKVREEYPLRREFHAYSVKLRGGSAEVREKLKELGFKVL